MSHVGLHRHGHRGNQAIHGHVIHGRAVHGHGVHGHGIHGHHTIHAIRENGLGHHGLLLHRKGGLAKLLLHHVRLLRLHHHWLRLL